VGITLIYQLKTMPTPVKAKVDSDTQKYIVRPHFSVLMERGKSQNYHIGGDVIDLTPEEADRVANQIEPYSDESLERIKKILEKLESEAKAQN
jgi:excinuclease UvrABC helicase subunit UvrB